MSVRSTLFCAMVPVLWGGSSALGQFASIQLIDVTQPSDTNIRAWTINDAGTVRGDLQVGPNSTHGFEWISGSGTAQVPSPAGATVTIHTRLNNAGEVAVVSTTNGLLGYQVFRYSGGYTQLPLPAGTARGFAFDINDSAAIVGWAADTADTFRRAQLWPGGGGVVELGTLGGNSEARGLNDAGVVVGGTGANAFRWTQSSGMTALAMLPGYTFASAADINNAGVTVGDGFRAGKQHAVIWNSAGQMTELIEPSLFEGSAGYALNEAGDVVGTLDSVDPTVFSTAMLATAQTGMIDLNILLSPADREKWFLRSALEINEFRQITGMGRYDPDGSGPLEGRTRPFFLQLPPVITVPEPTCYGGILALGVGLRRRARR